MDGTCPFCLSGFNNICVFDINSERFINTVKLQRRN